MTAPRKVWPPHSPVRERSLLIRLLGVVTATLLPVSATAAPRIGFNLPSWSDGGSSLTEWQAGIDSMAETGVRDVALMTYRFVDRSTGIITDTSAFGLSAPMPDAELKQTVLYAKRRGMRVTLSPFLYIDNADGIGAAWRGGLAFPAPVLLTFFAHYTAYISSQAELAESCCADRLMMGSELGALTADPLAESYWQQTINAARLSFSGVLTYSASWGDYQTVPFWSLLDEIAVSAYFPLATDGEATGTDLPSAATIQHAWSTHMTALRAFSAATEKPILLAEWGCVPYDTTTARTWHWKPSDTPDPGEQRHAYEGTLAAVAGQSDDWLHGIFLWHWSMPGNDGSNYAVAADSELAQLISNHLGTVYSHVIELNPGWTPAAFPFTATDTTIDGLAALGRFISVWQRPDKPGCPSFTMTEDGDSLQSLTPYWFHATRRVFLTQHSETPATGQGDIRPGWSELTVGGETRVTKITSLPGTENSLWGWNSREQQFFSIGERMTGPLPANHPNDTVLPGHVYWVRSTQYHTTLP